MGPSSYDSRSYCEPTRLDWESSSKAPVGALADSPLFHRVHSLGGTGELEPMILAMRWAGRAVRPVGIRSQGGLR